MLGGITAADIEGGDAVKTMDLIWAVMKLEVLQGLDIPKMINMVCDTKEGCCRVGALHTLW